MTNIEAFYRYNMMRRQSTLAAYARLMSNTHNAVGAGDSGQPEPPPPPPMDDKLKLVVETTSSYNKSGIYFAGRDDTSKPVVIDWGDGTIEQIDGDVSQKVHTYASDSTFNVVVENIKSYAASTNNSAWCQTTSQNAYTLKEVVVMPDNVTDIGANAFFQCSSLTSVTIGNNVTSIEPYAFYDSGLTSVMIPDSVTSIGNGAFYSLNGLTNVTIGNSVTSIGDYAFFNCTSLTSVMIPDSVTSIGTNAFFNCTSLTSVTIPDSVTSIGINAFFNCTGLTSVTIPDSVTSIGDYAFRNCTSLTSVTILDSVTSIGYQAFQGCNNLMEYYMSRFTCNEVKDQALSWGLGIDVNYQKFLVVVYCSDGAVIINDNSNSSN